MSKFEIWLLKRIFRKAVMQSVWHKRRIIFIYGLLAKAAQNEFTEDNWQTIKSFLIECHDHGLDEIIPY